MATAIRSPKPKKTKKIELDDDGIFSEAIQLVAHDVPQPIHLRRAAEALGVEIHEVPVAASVAELIAYVLGVKAVGGNDVAMKEFLDRFSPKAARAAKIDVNLGQANPVASQNKEEQAVAIDYIESLRLIK